MREVKFRGKAIMSIEELELMGIEHDSGWVYGNLIKNGNRPMITADILEEIEESIYPEWWVVVEPKSVGQYTGLKDKNGREIYEGDIVRCYGGAYWNGIYEYNYVIEVRDIRDLNEIVHSENVEILGNKYENPELLGGLIQMSKERLEELINRKPNRWGNLTIYEFERDIKILQEQAERVQELESDSYNAHLERLLNRREQQIKRYREALEAIYELAEYDEYDNTLEQIVSEIEKALEG